MDGSEFLQRKGTPAVAALQRESRAIPIVFVGIVDLQRLDLHKLSAVDATSFAIMKRARIRLAFTFDHHFAVVGFRLVG
jgi:predicted nucleic acid-binding protein